MIASRALSVTLRLVLAAGALLAGVDVHVLEFAAPSSAAVVVAGLEIHAGNCPHREHVPPVHNAHDCMLCKSGAARATGLQPDVVVRPVAVGTAWVAARALALRPTASPSGSLGARGPPATDA